jgi:hypothetical protein
VEPAVDRALSGAVELDETLGLEVILGLHCPRPLGRHELDIRARALDRALRADKADPIGPDRGCRVARFELNKRPRER